MAVSGTYTAETQDVGELIADAWIKAGRPAQMLGAEELRMARADLRRILTSLQNKGLTLWTTQKVYAGLRLNKPTVDLPTGTVDVLNASYLTPTLASDGTPASSAGGTAANAFDGDFSTACTQTSADGNISYQFTGSVTITHMAVCTNGTATYDLIFESSTDGSTWTTVLDTSSQSYTDDDLIWFEAQFPTTGTYFRVRETGGGTLNVRQLYFAYNTSSIPMSRQNRDDYFNLTNRFSTGTNPLQYWLDRGRDYPIMNVWPVPSVRTRAIELYVKRQIFDPGALMNDLDVPQRWQSAILYALAHALAEGAPEFNPVRIQYLAQRSAQALAEAFSEETDDSPINIIPDVTPYTR